MGFRLKRGLFSTVNETIPFARVQAVEEVRAVHLALSGLVPPRGGCRRLPGPGTRDQVGQGHQGPPAGGPGRRGGRAVFQFARAAAVPAVQTPSPCPLEVPAQLPLPCRRRQRPGCGRQLREAEKGDHLGAPRKGPERAPGPRAGATPVAPGHCSRGRGRARTYVPSSATGTCARRTPFSKSSWCRAAWRAAPFRARGTPCTARRASKPPPPYQPPRPRRRTATTET